MTRIVLISWIVFFSIIACCLNCYPQDQSFLPNVIGPSPNSAALARYGDIPVNLSTGVPNINIPLYTLPSSDIKVPISISYHSSGNKVTDIASWVGLGWSLNAGGVITRVVRGIPDDEPNGFIEPWYGNSIYKNGELVEKFEALVNTDGPWIDNNGTNWSDFLYIYFLPRCFQQKTDAESDIYYYNFMGLSGKFILSYDGTPHLIPSQNLTITPLFGSNGKLESWTIQTLDGTKYTFGSSSDSRETTESVTTIESYPEFGAPLKTTNSKQTFTSSWYLDNANSISGDFATFEYMTYSAPNSTDPLPVEYTNSYEILNKFIQGTADITDNTSSNCSVQSNVLDEYPLPSSRNSYFGIPWIVPDIKVNQKNTITDAKHIYKISTTQGYVVFNPVSSVTPRLDRPNEPSLASITVYNNFPNSIGGGSSHTPFIVKQFQFLYGYFVSPNCSLSTTCNRLYLSRVSEQDANLVQVVPPYIFKYNTTVNLPDAASKSYDHWGYYNGNLKSSLVPSISYNYTNNLYTNGIIYPFGSTNQIDFEGADRSPDPDLVQANILTDIIYPTGGKTQFVYEQNTISNGSTIYNQNVGGIRIKNIINMDDITNPKTTSTTNYDYAKTTGASSGMILSLPLYYYPKRYNLEYYLDGSHCYTQAKGSYEFIVASSYSISDLGAVQGNVNYTYVTVTKQPNDIITMGKSIYQFTGFDEYPDQFLTFTPNNNLNVIPAVPPTIGIQNYPSPIPNSQPTISRDYLRGLLLHRWDYDANGVLIKQLDNTYECTNQAVPLVYGIKMKDNQSHSRGKQIIRIGDGTHTNYYSFYQDFGFDWYKNIFQNILLTKTDEYDFETFQGNSQTKHTQTNYTYTGLLPRKISVSNNVQNRIIQTEFTYPKDFIFPIISLSDEALAIKSMQTNLPGQYIQKLTTVNLPNFEYVSNSSGTNVIQQGDDDDATSYVLNGEIWKFRSKDLKLSSVYTLETPNPILLSQYIAPSINNATGTFEFDNRFKQKMKYDYYTADEDNDYECPDNINHILQYHQTNDATSSLIWGYPYLPCQTCIPYYTSPIAKVFNSNQDRILYTSFESGEEGKWSFNGTSPQQPFDAKTGVNSFSGLVSGPSCGNSLPNGKYKIGFWVKGSGQVKIIPNFNTSNAITKNYTGITAWTYYETILDNPSFLQILTSPTLYIDELRVHPVDAKMTTFTYIPLVGKTSETDANCISTYYEYDSFNRLVLIRDQNQNILKKYEYGYRK